MKLYLASFFQEEFHGPGRKIGIAVAKPKESDCDLVFDPFAPEADSYWNYHKAKHSDPEAGIKFVEAYEKRLETFCKQVEKDAQEQGKSPIELLPFEDGDSLLSWEHNGNVSYRAHLAEYLRRLGYEVEEN